MPMALEKKYLQECIAQGWTWTQIIEDSGASYGQVQYWFNQYQIETPFMARQKRNASLFQQGFKECKKCLGVFSLEDFKKDPRSRDGHAAICIKDDNLRQKISSRQKYHANIEDARKKVSLEQKKRTERLKAEGKWQYESFRAKMRRYGVRDEDFIQQKWQITKCEICQNLLTREQIGVDHNHQTNAYRGIVCQYCNCAIGLFLENLQLMQQAKLYLERTNWLLPDLQDPSTPQRYCLLCDKPLEFWARRRFCPGFCQRKASHIRGQYGLSVAQLRWMRHKQNYRCYICDKGIQGKTEHVDHHPKVRALLCPNCNLGIGNLKDDPTRAQAIYEYLALHLEHR